MILFWSPRGALKRYSEAGKVSPQKKNPCIYSFLYSSDPRKIQQTNFTANLDQAGNTTIFFTIEQEKETIYEFSKGTVKIL